LNTTILFIEREREQGRRKNERQIFWKIEQGRWRHEKREGTG